MSRPITKITVEEYFLNTIDPITVNTLMYHFIGTDTRHEKRIKKILENLERDGKIFAVEAPSESSKMFGGIFLSLLKLPLTTTYYIHSSHVQSK